MPIGLRIARRRQVADLDFRGRRGHAEKPRLVGLHRLQCLLDGEIDQGSWNGRHRIVVGVSILDTEIVLVGLASRHAEFGFRLFVPFVQVVVADRPVDELRNGLAVKRLHLEVVRHEPQAGPEPVRCSAGGAVVGAAERERPFLNEIGLFRIGPVAEFAFAGFGFGTESHHGGPAGSHLAGIAQLAALENCRCIRTLRHLGGRRVEAAHVVVEVGIGLETFAGLEDDDLLVVHPQFVRDQRAGKTGSDNRHVTFNAGWGGHGRLLR